MQFSFAADGEDVDFNKKLNRLLPQQQQDIFATAIFVIIVPLGIATQLFYVMPSWWPTFGEAWCIRAAVIFFLTFNMYSNWVMMIKVGPSGRNTILPNVVKAGFRYCHSCHTNAPPRAHHCPVCDVCVLRRDHHCSFGAVCIGHFNQRYFVASVLNLSVLATILSYYAMCLMDSKIDGGCRFGNIWQIMLPHVAFVTRFLSLSEFGHVLLFVFSATVAMFSYYLVVAQVFCFVRGQTRVEFLMDVHAYQLGFLENIRQALGSRWPLVAFACFIPSPLPSDGISFVTREIHNAHTKDM